MEFDRVTGTVSGLTVEEVGLMVGKAGKIENFYVESGNTVFRLSFFNIVKALPENIRDAFTETDTYKNIYLNTKYVPTKEDFGVIAVFQIMASLEKPKQ